MKLILTESQYRKLSEMFDQEEERNIFGDPSENTLMVADLLLRQGLVEPGSFLIMDDKIQIFKIEKQDFDYLKDNSIFLNVYTIGGDVNVNVEGDDEDNYMEDAEDRYEVFRYFANLAENLPFLNWHIEGDKL